MLELFTEIGDWIVHGGFKTHLVVYILCSALGILILQWLFAQALRVVARKTDTSYPLLQQTFRGIPALLGILIGLHTALQFLTIPPRALLFLQRLANAMGILSVALLIARLGSGYLKQKFQRTNETFGSTSILSTIIDLIVYSVGFLFLLQSYGISITPLLTALGVGGLAVALALQDTLSNLFSGVNILVSKQIKMGDFVKLASGETGQIVDMNWRNTTIRDQHDSMVVVPNQKIASTILTNYAQPYAECSITVPVGVSYDSDLEEVEQITAEVAKEVLREIAGGVGSFEPFLRYTSFAESSVNFNVILRVKTVSDQHLIRHMFIKRLHARYRREGIVIPYPVRTVKMEPAVKPA